MKGNRSGNRLLYIDKGRFDLTADPADLYVFKVPGLRNNDKTPP